MVTTATAAVGAAGTVAPATSPQGGAGLRRWGRRGRAALPLVVLSSALGFGLYWVATQAGWLAVGWRPALATTLLYLAGVLAIGGALTRVIDGVEALALRHLDRAAPSPWGAPRPAPAPPSDEDAGAGRQPRRTAVSSRAASAVAGRAAPAPS